MGFVNLRFFHRNRLGIPLSSIERGKRISQADMQSDGKIDLFTR